MTNPYREIPEECKKEENVSLNKKDIIKKLLNGVWAFEGADRCLSTKINSITFLWSEFNEHYIKCMDKGKILYSLELSWFERRKLKRTNKRIKKIGEKKQDVLIKTSENEKFNDFLDALMR